MTARTAARVLLLGAITVALFAALISAPAHAATIRTGWIMNANQWQALQSAGYTGRAPQFRLCTDGGGAQAIPCTAGMTPAYENYYTLRSALRSGVRGYVVMDLEGWKYTPAYQAAVEAKYYRLAAQLCARYKVRLIAAPVVSTADGPAVEAAAARAGAWAVELQIQFATSNPPLYQQLTERAVAAIRAASKHTVIIGGLASDAGGYPTTAALMRASYDRTRALVSGYWLNAAPWTVHANGTPATGCAPDGCVTVAARFLSLIGVSS